MRRIFIILAVCVMSGCVTNANNDSHFQSYAGRTYRTRREAVVMMRSFIASSHEYWLTWPKERPLLRLREPRDSLIHGFVPANTPVQIRWVRLVRWGTWRHYVAQIELSNLPLVPHERIYLRWQEDDEPILGLPGLRRTNKPSDAPLIGWQDVLGIYP